MKAIFVILFQIQISSIQSYPMVPVVECHITERRAVGLCVPRVHV